MDNCIAILIDSVYSDCLSDNRTSVSSTPFIDKIAKKSLVAPNIFSYGPYTDAATIGLYNGVPTLSNFGYYYGVNSSEYNHFRVFHDNGYETFGLFYPYYLLSSKVRKDIDHPIYTSGFKYASVWHGKFEYSANIKKKRPLTDWEYDFLEKCLEMVFDCWSGFYEDIESSKEAGSITETLFDSTIGGGGYAQLKEEIKDYYSDKRKYLDRVLEQGMNHNLAKINEFDYGKQQDYEFLGEIYRRNKKFFKKLKGYNLKKNLIYNPFDFKKAIRCLAKYIKTRDVKFFRYFGNYGMLLLSTQMMIKRSLGRRDWQNLASMDKQINTFFEAYDKREDKDKPFYASLHVLEPHNNISFFSFDCFDHKQIEEELKYLSPIMGKGKFKGNILYQLSLRYVDLCVKKLFEGLKERGLTDNTTIMLVADHGTSYAFDTVRTHVVNTFHKENYNIPLLIYNKHLPAEIQGRYEGLYTSADILPTLFGVSDIKCPDQMKGHRIYKETKGRDYVITEYMGPGVPDMVNREAWMSVRNNDYVIAYIASLNKKIDLNRPVVFYDLTVDPLEKQNRARSFGKKDREKVEPLLKALEERFNEIRNDRDRILSDFDNFVVTKK